ncbi:hypothetical protein TSAR_009660 [Trichomalopsis sarcophagae]|uniref:Uncharacterized protein n=1 Tax=Trichomalopsis sarcophagae TaxID=543379 RepID=A0A232ELT0_9HYME|nr:hypothetical protein TSAR_009660 [Trichomalopsis sarcophagae]
MDNDEMPECKKEKYEVKEENVNGYDIFSNGIDNSTYDQLQMKSEKFDDNADETNNIVTENIFDTGIENIRKPVICTKDYEVLLFTSEYKSLRIDTGNVRDLYIDGDVIDAFSMINEKNWKNCVSVPTQHTKILLKEISEKEIDADWFMFHLRVDVDNRVLLHMDPLQNEKKIKRVDGQPFASKVF